MLPAGFFGGGAFGPPGGNGGTFEAVYRCYPVTFIDKAEKGDKVYMPPSALDRLATLQVQYPMAFKITNLRDNRSSHCGVLEFIADEGTVYLPYWMMQNLLLAEGDLICFHSARLPKARYVKLQPHTTDFLDISNPKAVLETTLRSFSCLTVNDTIAVHYNNRLYHIDIVEAKPAPAVSIIETDVEIDFAPPLDYVEPQRPPPQQQPALPTFSGFGAAPVAGGAAPSPVAPPAEPEAPKFLAFTGSGRRLDGKAAPASTVGPSAAAAAPMSIPAASTSAPGGSAAGGSSRGGGGSSSGASPALGTTPPISRYSGKLVFGGPAAGGPPAAGAAGASGAGAAAPAAAKQEEKPPEGPKFQAFTGKGNRLS